jgi:hypothetical protein
MLQDMKTYRGRQFGMHLVVKHISGVPPLSYKHVNANWLVGWLVVKSFVLRGQKFSECNPHTCCGLVPCRTGNTDDPHQKITNFTFSLQISACPRRRHALPPAGWASPQAPLRRAPSSRRREKDEDEICSTFTGAVKHTPYQ